MTKINAGVKSMTRKVLENDDIIKGYHTKLGLFDKTLNDKLEAMSLDLGTRVTYDHMRQNFRQLNEIILVKFEQVESIK